MKILNFKLKIELLLVFTILGIVNPSQASASSNFTTDYNILYNVLETGTTHADMAITLTNTSKTFYATSYQMNLGFDDVTQVVASDSAGIIKTKVDKTDSGYNLTLTFNRKALGLGSKLPFRVSFDTNSIAHQTGSAWEVNIPGISNPSEMNEFNVRINSPTSFGKPVYVKPAPVDASLIFDKEELGKSGVSIAYGEKQIYDFSLTYHLRNTNLFPNKKEIALPPNTNYQDVSIESIDPRPIRVTRDADGNWLAHYNMTPTEKKDIKVKGRVELRIRPKPSSITQDEIREFTKSTQFWQSNDKEILALARELKTPKSIYDYVVKALKYDFSRVTDGKSRMGAAGALNSPDSAVCREFTDLFIALARASGIPAREVDGYAYTSDTRQRPTSSIQDVLHAWPEYYDFEKKTWIMVDPTWGSTTGGIDYFDVWDYDHVAFAIKGINDSYPVPAGGYKLAENKNVKDVTVAFGTQDLDRKGYVDIKNSLGGTYTAGFPIQGRIEIINNSSSSIPSQPISISSSSLTPKDQAFQIPEIPPYGSEHIEVKYAKTGFLTNKDSRVTILFGDKKSVKSFRVAPFYLTKLGIGGISIVIFTLIILIIAGKSRRLHF